MIVDWLESGERRRDAQLQLGAGGEPKRPFQIVNTCKKTCVLVV